MTAGFGWLGEINNQFNKTKYDFPAVQAGVIPPYITWDGQHTADRLGHARVLVTVHQSEARYRNCEQLVVDQGTQHV